MMVVVVTMVVTDHAGLASDTEGDDVDRDIRTGKDGEIMKLGLLTLLFMGRRVPMTNRAWFKSRWNGISFHMYPKVESLTKCVA